MKAKEPKRIHYIKMEPGIFKVRGNDLIIDVPAGVPDGERLEIMGRGVEGGYTMVGLSERIDGGMELRFERKTKIGRPKREEEDTRGGMLKYSMPLVNQIAPRRRNEYQREKELRKQALQTAGIDPDKIRQTYNLDETYGIALTESGYKALEGIIEMLTDTGYNGHELIEPGGDRFNELASANPDIEPGTSAGTYSSSRRIPILKTTQAEWMRLSGFHPKNEHADFLRGLEDIGQRVFAFFYKRPKMIRRRGGGMMWAREADGAPALELVLEFGTIATIRRVMSQDGRQLEYYEILPSAVLIDQVTREHGGHPAYYLAIPKDWREEIRKLRGRNPTIYETRLLFYLRQEFEERRRHNMKSQDPGKPRKDKPYFFSIDWRELAQTMSMPESVWRKNAKRAKDIINESLLLAERLGYVRNFKPIDKGDTVAIHLNEDYYPVGGRLK